MSMRPRHVRATLRARLVQPVLVFGACFAAALLFFLEAAETLP